MIESLEDIASDWIILPGEVIKNEKIKQSKEDFLQSRFMENL